MPAVPLLGHPDEEPRGRPARPRLRWRPRETLVQAVAPRTRRRNGTTRGSPHCRQVLIRRPEAQQPAAGLGTAKRPREP
eukprot:15438590-Alexandrium_andersonii.AAC.1